MTDPLKRIVEVYVFVFAFLFASRPLNDGDFWFHLKTGEYIWTTGQIPKQEIFSFTNYGAPWIAHGWLSGAFFYFVYSKVGLSALMFIFATLAALAFWLVFRRIRSHVVIAGFATLLGVWAVLPNLGVRPRVFSLLFASIFLAVLSGYVQEEKRRLVWWLGPLMVLWVNLHGGFVIGLLLIGLTLVGIGLDAWVEGRKLATVGPKLLTLLLVLLSCLVAIGVNPYGLKMYALPLEVMRTPVFQAAVVDFLSPNFHQAQIFPFALLALITIAALALSPKRISPSKLLLFLATFYSALQTQRNILIFSLVAAPLFAEHFQSWLDSTRFGKIIEYGKEPVAASRGKIILSGLLLLPIIFFAGQLKRVIYVEPRQENTGVPMKAVEYMQQSQLTGNTVTVPNIWGGYLIWALPSNPVYIDGRNAYPTEFVQEYVDITNGRKDLRGPFNQYGVKNAIVSKSSYMARELGEASDWRKVFEDEFAVVFTKQN